VDAVKPLVEVLKSLIERTYDIPPLVGDLAPFIVGDAGFRRLYAGDAVETRWVGARVLVRESSDTLRAVLYCPDSLVRHLERFNPLHGIGDVNVREFGVLVEEVDHLVMLASRAAEGRQVTLLELEHHANVTKYLAVMHFLGRQTGRRRVAEPLRHWARHHLFERLSREEGATERRYREAARLAWQYLRLFERLAPEQRPSEIRAFHRRPFEEILHLVSKN
jgi:hypothetical protein